MPGTNTWLGIRQAREYHPQPGEFLLVETHHFVSKLIRFGQRSYGKEYAKYNHVAMYIGNGDIVEALTKGVVISKVSKYADHDTRWVRTDSGFEVDIPMRNNAVRFAKSCVGQEYGRFTILCIGLKTLFKGRFNFGVQGTSICSGLVARSLERMGYNFNPYDPATLTPAYLARSFTASTSASRVGK